MTLKQYHLFRFYRLLEAYRAAEQSLHTPEGRAAFIILSVQIHGAKAHVPKQLRSLVKPDVPKGGGKAADGSARALV